MMQSGTPKTAIDYIHALGRFTGRPGLHRIRALCAALGDPQDGLDVYKRQRSDSPDGWR